MMYLPGLRRADGHVRRHAAGAQDARPAPAGSSLKVLSKCCFQISSPVFGVERVDVVGNAGLDDQLAAGRFFVVQPPDHQRLEQRVHLPRLVIELRLPEQLASPGRSPW